MDLIILYVLHGIRDGSVNEGNLDAFAQSLGFESAEGSPFFVKSMMASKERHYLDVNSDGNYQVATPGRQMGVTYALKYGPEFGWSFQYDEAMVRNRVLNYERELCNSYDHGLCSGYDHVSIA